MRLSRFRASSSIKTPVPEKRLQFAFFYQIRSFVVPSWSSLKARLTVSLLLLAVSLGLAARETPFSLQQLIGERAAQGHRPLSYRAIWKALEQTDENPKNPAHIISFYSQQSLAKRCHDSTKKICEFQWNREHLWPKSHGFPKPRQWAYTDLHHLRPEINFCNQKRSHFDFGEVGAPASECQLRLSKGKKKLVEVADEIKGDLARALFYMAARYQGTAAKTHTPDLILVDHLTTSGRPQLGKLCTLLQWHLQDPVSETERVRNRRVQLIQGNRNPFIDEPELVKRFWQASCPPNAPPADLSKP